MKTRMVEERIGENMGPIDWTHPMALNKPLIWREAEKNPAGFLLNGRRIVEIGMYDGWPYWRPTPAILRAGPLGLEWDHFNSYGVHPNSITPLLEPTGSAP